MANSSLVGKKIEEARKAKKFSQAKLAELVGVSRASISLYETGAGSPSYKVLNKLAESLEIPFGDLASLGDNNQLRIPDSLYDTAYVNGARSGRIEKYLGRKENYRDIYFYYESAHLASEGGISPNEESEKPLDWPTVPVLELPGVDYSFACVDVVEDNAMKPRYPEGSRHVFHAVVDINTWYYLTGVYGFSVPGKGIIIRQIISNDMTSLVLADADNNRLIVKLDRISMIWRVGQTIHMPVEN